MSIWFRLSFFTYFLFLYAFLSLLFSSDLSNFPIPHYEKNKELFPRKSKLANWIPHLAAGSSLNTFLSPPLTLLRLLLLSRLLLRLVRFLRCLQVRSECVREGGRWRRGEKKEGVIKWRMEGYVVESKTCWENKRDMENSPKWAQKLLAPLLLRPE